MTLWGGRFAESPDEVVWSFTTDDSDRRLLEVDVRGSIAHAAMLGETGIIPPEEAEQLIDGLGRIIEEVREGSFVFVETDEDVHTAVERRLTELVGDVAGKLHTGRSRNDQVATDLRLYLKETGRARIVQLHEAALLLCDLAEVNASVVIPTYTHLQQAQTTTLGDHLLAYAWMLVRDAGRFESCRARLDASPLGAGASAGSSLPIDREATATALGFDDLVANTLDAVASRDFVAEYVFSAAQAMVHLSRLAEEIVLWASNEFAWVSLSDTVATGSSAMPHKKNPDVAELVRGRAAGVIGDVSAILALQKGLPLTYNRDLQEDKRLVFHADDVLAGALAAMSTLLPGLEFHPPAPGAATTSLDLADVLVTRGVPFREAHRVVGEVVRLLDGLGRGMGTLTDDDLTSVDARFEPGDTAIVNPAASVERRRVTDRVRDQISELRGILSS